MEPVQKSAFESHPIWRSLSALQSALDKADERTEPSAAEPLDAVRYVTALIRSHEQPNDTAPYSSTGLNAVNSQLPNATNEVANYASNGNVGHLANAENYADAILDLVGSWPSSLLKGGAAAQANRVFAEYRDDATATIKFLRESNTSLREELADQKEASQTALDALETEISGLSAKIKQDEARLDQALTTTNDAFTAKQTEREAKFNSWLEERAASLKELAGDDLKQIKQDRVTAANALEAIQTLRDDTQTVAGLATGDQVARGYKRYSLRQWVAGLITYAIGFVALGFGAVLVLKTLHGIKPTDDISWQFATMKLGITVTALAAAVVAFRLGSHLLAEASTAKRFELELKAVGPLFPHDSERDMLQTVKKDLVERSFGQSWGTSQKSQEVMDQKLVERVADAVSRLVLRSPSGL